MLSSTPNLFVYSHVDSVSMTVYSISKRLNWAVCLPPRICLCPSFLPFPTLFRAGKEKVLKGFEVVATVLCFKTSFEFTLTFSVVQMFEEARGLTERRRYLALFLATSRG
jgi:hypothetical protein